MGQYTGGFNGSRVLDCLKGRLGWKQPQTANSPQLNSDNTGSASGRYFNDGSFHPLVTIDNLKATIEDANASDDRINQVLDALQETVITQAVSAVFNQSELIEQVTLFERTLNNDTLIASSSKFVGIRFKLAPGDVSLQVLSLSLYFNQAKTFNLYLYHDAKKDFIWSQEVSSVENDQTIITPDTELILSNTGIYKSGHYYLGYFQDELGDCQPYYEQYCRPSTYGFNWDFFQASRLAGSFDKKQVALTSYNFGLNAEVQTFHDHTDKIIRSASLFDNLIGLQMAYHVCKQIIYTARSNGNERILNEAISKIGLQFELDGKVPITDVPRSTGLQDRIDAEVTRLRKTFSPVPKSQIVSLC
jgi:hypothetical protein